MSKDSDKITFVVCSDLQFAPLPPAKNRYFARGREKLKEVLSSVDLVKPDFLINLGDTIDRGFENFKEIMPLFKMASCPVYHVLGNHDYEVADAMKSHIPIALGISNYYHFSVKKWRFIILDGNEISTFANLPGSSNFQEAEKLLLEMENEQCINSHFWNGGLGENQLKWLEATLKSATEQGESVILFCHYPLYPSDKHNLLNDAEVVGLITKYPCTKAWFSGHNHQGNYGLYKDIHFINARGMVEGELDNAWSVVSLENNRILMQGFGNEISAHLNLKNG